MLVLPLRNFVMENLVATSRPADPDMRAHGMDGCCSDSLSIVPKLLGAGLELNEANYLEVE